MKKLVKCKICGVDHNNKVFCSEKCQHESYRVKKVKRIIINCLNCNKEMEILKTKTNKKYCSRKCCDEHKKITYIGKNNPMFGVKMSVDTKKKHSIASKNMWKKPDISEKIKNSMKDHNKNSDYPSGWSDYSRKKRIKTTIEKYGVVNIFMNDDFKKKSENSCIKKYGKTRVEIMIDALHKKKKTTIEKIFENFLIENNIKYESQYKIYFFNNEKKLKFRIYDFILCEKNIVVEIDGDYWHGNNLFFKNLNETQLSNIENDKFKDKLANLKNLEILRFWGSDILNDKYKEKILKLYE